MTIDAPEPVPPLQQFELAWKQGKPPAVRPFAREHSTPDHNLLPELVILNFACLWECQGDAPPVTVYLNQFSEFRNSQEVVFELLTIEILNWPHPDRGRYLEIFPQLKRELNRLFDLLAELRPDKVREWRDTLRQFTIGHGQSISITEEAVPLAALKPSESITLSDQFQIGALAGRGGFKRVYRGSQNSTGRQVAVKQLRETSPGRCRRFVSETRIQAALDHQNIPPVSTLGPQSKQPTILVEKFISAPNWATFLRDPRTGLRRNLGILLTVSRTVAFAHERGIIHRDIKPENVLVDGFGQVYLTDWGLAAQVGDIAERDEQLSHVQDDAGRIIGTPFYMPPEMALGRTELTGLATDVFQLGAVLYEIVARRGPFGMNPATAWVRAAGHRIPELPRSVSREFRAVVAKAMAQDSSHRYATAREFADDLQQLIDDENVSVCKPPLPAKLRRTVRKHRTAATSLGAALLAGLLVVIGASMVVAEKNERLEEANTKLKTRNQEILALNISLDATNNELTATNLELDGTNRELAATNIRLEETNQSLDDRNREIADANVALRKERDRLKLALEIGFKLLRGIETEQYHSLDDAYSDIVQNGFRLPDQERSAMLPLYLALVSMQKADDFLTRGAQPDSGLAGLFNDVTSKAAAAREAHTALDWLNQSIRESDQVGLAWLLRAQLRMEFLAHPKQDVLKDWNRAVALLPRCSAAFSGRGFGWIGVKDFDQAANDLARAIELDPRNEYARYGLAEIQLDRKNYKGALEHYHAALELPQRYNIDPNWKQLLYQGTAYSHWGRAPQRLKAGNAEGAFEDYRLALRFSPAEDRPKLWPNLLLVLSQIEPGDALVKQLQATSTVRVETSETFQFTRDCLVVLAAARAGTLRSADIKRLVELALPGTVTEEITDQFRANFAEQANSDAIDGELRQALVKLSRALQQD